MGYLPLVSPSKLVKVGSLFHIDQSGRFITTLCPADAKMVEALSRTSPGPRIVGNHKNSGSFSAQLQGFFIGKTSDEFADAVYYSLFDVNVTEIDAEANRRIRLEMTGRKECSEEIADVIRLPGYICQGQRTIEASLEYFLDMKSKQLSQIDLTNTGNQVLIEAVKDEVKAAVKAQSQIELTEKAGKLMTAQSLIIGVSMNAACLTPRGAYFARMLPRHSLDRLLNTIKFQFLELFIAT